MCNGHGQMDKSNELTTGTKQPNATNKKMLLLNKSSKEAEVLNMTTLTSLECSHDVGPYALVWLIAVPLIQICSFYSSNGWVMPTGYWVGPVRSGGEAEYGGRSWELAGSAHPESD